ncbi:hypothetical protein R3P38DRAFT_2845450 [Favolaschia claudopus]|uniref:MYND-type domain-containing protein n=1 Tax=Favolaschia claudopus TaxID=2862362 RepID=A0AAW0DTU0_9AGAR
MPAVNRSTTFVHRVTGFRINLHTTDVTREDHGVPDACRACGKTAKEMSAQKPPQKLMCCTRCKSNGNTRILYCSKACQVVDYKDGRPPNQPPHKRSCGRNHLEPSDNPPVDPSLLPVIRVLDSEHIKLYTDTPTTALQAQLEFLTNNCSAHYGFRRPKNGKYVAHQIQGMGGELFLQMRAEAMERREPASIALMEKLLAMSIFPTNLYTAGQYVSQLETEYEVDLEECHRALERSARHESLFRAWVDWAGPRIRDDAPALGVHFMMPWYYLPAGKFLHPVKYHPLGGGL